MARFSIVAITGGGRCFSILVVYGIFDKKMFQHQIFIAHK